MKPILAIIKAHCLEHVEQVLHLPGYFPCSGMIAISSSKVLCEYAPVDVMTIQPDRFNNESRSHV